MHLNQPCNTSIALTNILYNFIQLHWTSWLNARWTARLTTMDKGLNLALKNVKVAHASLASRESSLSLSVRHLVVELNCEIRRKLITIVRQFITARADAAQSSGNAVSTNQYTNNRNSYPESRNLLETHSIPLLTMLFSFS